jgi:hypothetical protein
MTDEEVALALRSGAALVVIEAPGGTGKTFQAAAYAAEVCPTLHPARLLALSHTHAAKDVFDDRTRGLRGFESRTIDGLIGMIAEAYPSPFQTALVNGAPDFEASARRVAALLRRAPYIAAALARRYPVVICDEHQDASVHQHDVILAMKAAGARIRAFGDPVQRIPGGAGAAAAAASDQARWTTFYDAADIRGALSTPHRWRPQAPNLGAWILENRERLKASEPLRLSGRRPEGLAVIQADNITPRAQGFRLETAARREIDQLLRPGGPLLVLSHHTATVQAIRAYLGRSMPIWEGHTRSALLGFVSALAAPESSTVVADAVVAFLQEVATGFSNGLFADRFRQEVAGDAVGRARGKPAQIQGLARLVVEHPNHRGAALCLRALHELIASDPAFAGVHLDHPREFWEAVSLADADSASAGLAAIAQRRAYRRWMPPARAISTIHKSKGLEAPHVVVMPCDATTFREKDRNLLYVAISRATESLTLVVSRSNPSPLIEF